MCYLIVATLHRTIVRSVSVVAVEFMHSNFWVCFCLCLFGLHTFIVTADTSIDIFIVVSAF